MPYYCTVPRCTSMAGKAKNVSFHQFPRDQELARLWNNILKRGKPYTKYSKVCSLHFRPEDYTITSAGKNKGQWRTLRKDAIPSQNLPSDSPVPYSPRRTSGQWVASNVPPLEPQLQQLAQAIYVQTMFAMQAAGVTDPASSALNGLQRLPSTEEPQPLTEPRTSTSSPNSEEIPNNPQLDPQVRSISYKCDDCSKCFKDPDVFILHKRTHKSEIRSEKENYNLNNLKPEMLKSNPILANLLKNTVDNSISNIFNADFEKQVSINFSSVENYLRNVSKSSYDDEECDNSELSDNIETNNLVIDENVA